MSGTRPGGTGSGSKGADGKPKTSAAARGTADSSSPLGRFSTAASAQAAPQGRPPVWNALLGLSGVSILAGFLVAALFLPMIAVASNSTNQVVGFFDDLPANISIGTQSQRNTLYATQGGQPVAFAQVFDQNRQDVAWENVSQFAKDALVAGEDRRFYSHGGVDIAGIIRAAISNAGNTGETQGASTLSQQLVKNLLIQDALNLPTEEERDAAYDAAQAQTINRKLKEAKLAITLEKEYSKDEILLGYLNIAGFGGNTYGIESAAQQYFSVSSKDLTLAQAASLIAIVQEPNALDLDTPENWPANLERRNVILASMLNEGMVTQAQFDEAIATPIDATTVKLSTPANGCLYATAAAYFCQLVLDSVKDMESLGATVEERQATWKRGGLSVYTTLDLDQQAVASTTLAARAPATETRFKLGASATTVQVGTGRIITMAQNTTFDNTPTAPAGSTSVNYNTDYAYGGSTGFATGSTYKLFTLVNWLQNGHTINESVNGNVKSYRTFTASCDPSVGQLNKAYVPENDSKTNAGIISVRAATAGSINAAYIDMASQLDLCDIRDTAISMGVHRADGQPLNFNPSDILGTNELAPITIANAYATIASGGVLCTPISVDRIVKIDGTELAGQNASCHQAIEPAVAAQAAIALQGVITNGTGTASNPRNGIEHIAKTGTSDKAVQTMVAAASTKLASAVWVGNVVGTQNLSRIRVAGSQGNVVRHAIMRPLLVSLDKSVEGADAADFPDK